MIITRTPLRVSLVGGGTDLVSFYENHGGAVVSMSIDKYLYISINKHFDGRIRLSYSRTENVDKPSQLTHDIVRACLEMHNLDGVEVTSVSDIPGEGSGLGSSSAFTVGLLKAIGQYIGMPSCSPRILSETAYMVELGCDHHCGKQDFYSAVYGGFNLFQFHKNGNVCIEPLLTTEQRQEFQRHFLLFWTGKTRRATKILKQQRTNIAEKGNAVFFAFRMRELAIGLADELRSGNFSNVGSYLNENWMLKKKLASGISTPWIDDIYDKGLAGGATGGKICGAGGGGFMLFFAKPAFHNVIEQMVGLRRIPFHIEEEGSKVIYGTH